MIVQFPIQTKAAVTVAEMARMLGLSRARFYQLIGSAFPHPVYDVATRRPFYVEEVQKVCLEVRRRNCGVDGKPILFYSRGAGSPKPSPKRRLLKPAEKAKNKFGEIIGAVRELGLSSVTRKEVELAIDALYPQGIEGVDQSEVIRSVFVKIQRQNSADNLGR